MQEIKLENLNNPEYKGKNLIVKVGAEWCTECRLIEPVLEKFQQDFPEMMFFSLDVDKNGSIAEEYKIEQLPTIIAFKNGKLVSRWDESIGDLRGWLNMLTW